MGLRLTGAEHAVADEAVAHTRNHRNFSDLHRKRHHRSKLRLARFGPAHDFQQLHHVGRREEMHAQHRFRPRGDARDLVDIQIAGVRREDRAGLGHLVEAAEHVLLHLHALIDRFDHQIGLGQGIEFQRRRQAAHCGFGVRRLHLATLDGVLVVLAHRGHAPVERFLRHFHDGHRDARRQEIHCDSATHRARTDHAHAIDRHQSGIGRDIVDRRGQLAGGVDVFLGAGNGVGHRVLSCKVRVQARLSASAL